MLTTIEAYTRGRIEGSLTICYTQSFYVGVWYYVLAHLLSLCRSLFFRGALLLLWVWKRNPTIVIGGLFLGICR